MKTLYYYVLLFFVCALESVVGNDISLEKVEPSLQGAKRSADGESISLPGGIGSNGEFYANVGLGNPAQYFYLQVDTGSADLAVYGTGCSSCAYTNEFTLTSTSTIVDCSNPNYDCPTCVTYESTSACAFEDSYGSGASINGFVLTDFMAVGDYSGITIDFGFIQVSQAGGDGSGLEHPPVDGIWGLAGQDLSGWFGAPAMDSIVGQLGLVNMFSMCLVSGSAVMSIGIDYTSDGQFTWVDMTGSTYYPVDMTDLWVGSSSLGYGSSTYNSGPPGNGAIVDSGTTLLLIPPSAFTAFQDTLTGMCPGLHGICDVSAGATLFDGNCYTFTQLQLNAYPDVTVYIDGAPYVLTADAYIYPFQSYRCMGIANGISGYGAILGDVFMQNYHVAFDRVNSRVGFAPLSTCPAAGVTATGNVVPQTTGAGSGSGGATSVGQTTQSSGTSASGNIVSLGTYLPSGFNYKDIHTYPIWSFIVAGLVGAFILIACVLCCCYMCAPTRRGGAW